MAKTRARRRAACVAWLVAHADLWRPAFELDGAAHGLTRDRQRQLVEGLRAAGLIAKSTYWLDVKLSALLLLAMPQVAAGGPMTFSVDPGRVAS